MAEEITLGRRLTSGFLSLALIAGLSPAAGLAFTERAYADDLVASSIAIQADDEEGEEGTEEATYDFGTVVAANLEDRSSDKISPLFEEDSYAAWAEPAEGQESVYNVTISARELVKHTNAENNQNYWVGVGVPFDKANLSYKWGDTDGELKSVEVTQDAPDMEGDEYQNPGGYFTFYFAPAESDDVLVVNKAFEEMKKTIEVYQKGGEGESTKVATYNITFDVTVAGTEEAEEAAENEWYKTFEQVAPAPLSDRKTSPDGSELLEIYTWAYADGDYETKAVTAYVGAEELPMHNGDASLGAGEDPQYWVGIGVPFISGAKYYKGSSNEADDRTEASFTDNDGNKYLAYYFAAKGKDVAEANAAFDALKGTITVKSADGEVLAVYTIGFSDVTVEGTEAIDKAEVDAFIAQVNALGTADASDAYKDKVYAAKDAYYALKDKDLDYYEGVEEAKAKLDKAEADYKAAKEAADKAAAEKAAADKAAAEKAAADKAAAEKAAAEKAAAEKAAAEKAAAEKAAAEKAAAEAAANAGLAVGATATAGTGAAAAAVTAVSADEVAYAGPADKSAKTATVPATVQVNGKTYNVTSIKANAFKGSKVTKVTVGDNVKSIGSAAFQNAKKLKTLILGKNVKTIGKKALKGAKKLKKVTVKSSKLTKKSFKNMLKGSKVKTVKLKGVSKKAKKNYKKWAKAYKVKVK